MEKELELIRNELNSIKDSNNKIDEQCDKIIELYEQAMKRLSDAALLVRKYTYSVTTTSKKNKEVRSEKVTLEDDKLAELMQLLEGSWN